jgi:drug/metabolite transporter (DMT)-like permease
MSHVTRAWIQIHFCVVLWGFTAILGKLITLAALPLVWWRMFIVTAVLLMVPAVWRGIVRIGPELRWAYAGIGLLVCIHWVTFYASIKLANASVAVTCMAVTPILLAFIEPWIAKRRFDLREVGLGLLVIPGVVLVIGGTPDGMHAGILVGVVSAFFVAVFGSLNKRLAHASDALSVTFLELGAGTLALSAIMPFATAIGGEFVWPNATDAWLLAALAIGCTLLPFALSLVALRQLSAFGTTLAINLEPVYAIGLAALFLGEERELTAQFYLGVAIIMAIVFAYPFLGRRKKNDDSMVVNVADAVMFVARARREWWPRASRQEWIQGVSSFPTGTAVLEGTSGGNSEPPHSTASGLFERAFKATSHWKNF